MSKSLVIVESPAKCKKIESYLGQGYKVIASFGHIRSIKDLKSIDLKNNFKTTYSQIDEPFKMKQIERLKTEISKASEVILATDDDREGEAIAWHICDLFNLPVATTKRIIFHEITEKAIKSAIMNPTIINMKLVNAQQSRQILDLLVGYTISPILWSHISKKYDKSLSAGRCQSPALRLVYDNYLDIKASPGTLVYNTIGYFTNLNLVFELNKQLKNKDDVITFLNQSKTSEFAYSVSAPKKTIKKNPEPLTTSLLQQLASNNLHLSPKDTMKHAQQLYEGGYITYMRTDSKKYSTQFVQEVKSYITAKYETKYISQSIDNLVVGFTNVNVNVNVINDNALKSQEVKSQEVKSQEVKSQEVKSQEVKSQEVKPQEAHEAIRPVDINLLVPILSESLSDLHPKAISLYILIWKRTLESCMPSAQYSAIKSSIDVYDDYKFQHKSEQVIFPGWRIVENRYEPISKDYQYLLTIKSGAKMKPKKIESKFTIIELKSHYSEAHLVQLLEENGIGRPSTFASLIDKLQERLYVEKQTIKGKEIECIDYFLDKEGLLTTVTNKRAFGNENGKLVITPLGIIIIEFLIKHFDTFFNYEYTKSMECELDLVANDMKQWYTVCDNCYTKLIYITKGLKEETKFSINIDDEHSIIIGKYGPVIKKVDAADNKVTFLPTKKNLDIDELTTLSENNELFLEDIIVTPEDQPKKSETIGKYKGKDMFIKKGKFGLYAQWGKEMKSLKEFGTTPIEKIEYIEVLKILEKDGVLDMSKPVGFVRELNSHLSIRTGKFGDYIMYKKPRAKKPEFLKLLNFVGDYKKCDKILLLNWIKQTYNAE
jgi:DNA topoisomerase I